MAEPSRATRRERASVSEPVGGDLRERASVSEPAGGDLRERVSVSEPVGGDLRERASASEPVGGDRIGVPSRLASAGRWVGERDRGRGWEDYLAEFLAAILTWAGIGWLLDRWLGTDPWLLISGAILGNSLGIYLLWIRSKSEHEKASGKQPGGGS